MHKRLFCDPLPYVCYSLLRGNPVLPLIYEIVLEEYTNSFCGCVSLCMEKCTTAVCCEDLGTIFH